MGMLILLSIDHCRCYHCCHRCCDTRRDRRANTTTRQETNAKTDAKSDRAKKKPLFHHGQVTKNSG
jgi:hypothetical protein